VGSSRFGTAIAGLLVTLVASVALWKLFGIPFLFVAVPFVPFLFRNGDSERPPVRECPQCGFRTRDPEFDYCPRDGNTLETR
jgi:hypothetical protein